MRNRLAILFLLPLLLTSSSLLFFFEKPLVVRHAPFLGIVAAVWRCLTPFFCLIECLHACWDRGRAFGRVRFSCAKAEHRLWLCDGGGATQIGARHALVLGIVAAV